jgi:hypothetical protein
LVLQFILGFFLVEARGVVRDPQPIIGGGWSEPESKPNDNVKILVRSFLHQRNLSSDSFTFCGYREQIVSGIRYYFQLYENAEDYTFYVSAYLPPNCSPSNNTCVVFESEKRACSELPQNPLFDRLSEDITCAH